MNHIMLDLETFGTEAGSAIASIGAVRFDETEIGDSFYACVDLTSCQTHGLRFDASTITWWMSQSDEARQALAVHPVSLPTALESFAAWVGKPDAVWGNGATFDNVIIAAAFRACGIKQPWRYSQDRCYRTLAGLCPNTPIERSGTHHNAKDDAITQAKHLQACVKWLCIHL